MIGLAVAISDAQTKRNLDTALNVAVPEIAAKTSTEISPVADIGCEQEKILGWIERYFEVGSRPLILISDLFKRSTDPNCGLLNRECQRRFGARPLGTLAIMGLPERVADIDRSIRPDVVPDELMRAIILVIRRLEYITPPSKSRPVDPGSITIRPLRSDNERELRDYFRLRHEAYTIMGYLDELAESSPSKLEMNEADVHSIHLGAFYRSGPRETLIGSARVVTNRDADSTLQEILEMLAANDPIARQRIAVAYQLDLPIFQTHKGMNAIMAEVYRNGQSCGELSRVIVDPAFRGNGISRGLVSEALVRGVNRGLRRIFLECLRIHTQLYEKHGFRLMPGLEARVIDVNRTMVAMELQREVIENIAAKASALAA
jgi:GNAT superfamily N-acetyltransferase